MEREQHSSWQGGVLLLLLALVVAIVYGVAVRRPAVMEAERLNEVAEADSIRKAEAAPDSLVLHPFDPNTVEYAELRTMGIDRKAAVSLLKFRAAGKVFRIREDVALCYGITDSLYALLSPYITIGKEFAIKSHTHDYPTRFARRDTVKRLQPEPFLIDTVSAPYLVAIGALSRRQAEVFVRWRNRSGFRSMEEVRACYVVDDSVATALEPYIRFTPTPKDPFEEPIELNRADSATLVSLYGIGAKSAEAIIAYRKRLGGFHRVEQLSEVKGVLERNYEKILQQIWCDSNEISKIDINFAAPSRMEGHPYLPPRTLRRLLKQRQLKGGWTCTQELVEQNILTHEEAERLAPYLVFGVQATKSE